MMDPNSGLPSALSRYDIMRAQMDSPNFVDPGNPDNPVPYADLIGKKSAQNPLDVQKVLEAAQGDPLISAIARLLGLPVREGMEVSPAVGANPNDQ